MSCVTPGIPPGIWPTSPISLAKDNQQLSVQGWGKWGRCMIMIFADLCNSCFIYHRISSVRILTKIICVLGSGSVPGCLVSAAVDSSQKVKAQCPAHTPAGRTDPLSWHLCAKSNDITFHAENFSISPPFFFCFISSFYLQPVRTFTYLQLTAKRSGTLML